MADVMKHDVLEQNSAQSPIDTAVEEADAEANLFYDDDDIMIGKYERPPTRRALTHEEFEALLEFLRQPPKPFTPETKRMIANYKRFKARLV